LGVFKSLAAKAARDTEFVDYREFPGLEQALNTLSKDLRRRP